LYFSQGLLGTIYEYVPPSQNQFVENQAGRGGCIFSFCSGFQRDSADGEKDGDLSTHSGKTGTPFFSVASENQLDFLFRICIVSGFIVDLVVLCMGDSFSGTMYIYEGNSFENGKFIAGLSWHETKPAGL